MKVVLFCGGLGTRLREYSGEIPKPMVKIGYRPILWHVMKYYAHFGHKEFILCLGYKADVIKQFFLNYEEWISNDFTLSGGGKHLELENNDIADWHITFVDTGLHSNIGQRLVAVKKYVDNDEMFLANYSDGLSDLDLDSYLAEFRRRGPVASFVAVRPSQSFHAVKTDGEEMVTGLEPVSASDTWVNGGFMCLRREIFDYMKPGEELVEQPFGRLIAERKLWAPRHRGFWAAMDTFKDKITFDRMEARGECPWMVWKR